MDALTTVGSPALWIGFAAAVAVMLALDLGVFHRKAHAVGFREAATWSAVWVGLALLFNAALWWRFGAGPGVEFLTAYLVEKSLSVDNIFVFVVLFSSLAIPAAYQHRVLFWGVLGAVVLRAAMILGGTALLARFHWLVYPFAAVLILSGLKLLLARGDEEAAGPGAFLRWLRRVIPTTSRLDGPRFLSVENGRRVATPLLLALVAVEAADVVFAVDSVPAVLAVTSDPFIAFTSNVLAILGLRSLFFLVSGLVEKLRYLKVGLAAVLVFVGAKMALVGVVKVPPALSLAVIAAILSAAAGFSLWRARQAAPEAAPVPLGAVAPPAAPEAVAPAAASPARAA